MAPPLYGMDDWGHLFTDRQLVVLDTYSTLLGEVQSIIMANAEAADFDFEGDSGHLREGGSDVLAYSEAVLTYLAFGIDRMADISNAFCMWESSRTQVRHLFTRQAIPMLWDFAETNPFGGAAGDYAISLDSVARSVERLPVSLSESGQREPPARPVARRW